MGHRQGPSRPPMVTLLVLPSVAPLVPPLMMPPLLVPPLVPQLVPGTPAGKLQGGRPMVGRPATSPCPTTRQAPSRPANGRQAGTGTQLIELCFAVANCKTQLNELCSGARGTGFQLNELCFADGNCKNTAQ